MINAFRYGILGISDISIGYAFSIIILFILILGSIAMYLLHKGIGLKS